MLVFAISCSSESPPPQQRSKNAKNQTGSDSVYKYVLENHAAYQITFQKVLTIRDSLGIGTMGRIAVDDKNRIYIAEGGFRNNSQTIHIYSPTGDYIGNMGRSGSGPGEFNRLAQIAVQNDRLFAYDSALKRISVFSLKSHSSMATIVLDPEHWKHIDALEKASPARFYLGDENKILLQFTDPLQPVNTQKRYARYYWLDKKGDIIPRQVFKTRDVNFYTGTGIPQPQLASQPTLAYHRSALVSVSDSGHIYSAWTNDFEIEVYDPSGRHLRTFDYSFENASLIKNNIYSRYENNSQFGREAFDDMPGTWPALNDMFLDDNGRLWVSAITESEDTYRWWVLGKEGKPVGTFEWPGNRLYRDREERKLKLVKDSYLYAIHTDSVSGLQQVDKYRILLN